MLLHRASGCPLTHVHMQLADAAAVEIMSRQATAMDLIIKNPQNKTVAIFETSNNSTLVVI